MGIISGLPLNGFITDIPSGNEPLKSSSLKNCINESANIKCFRFNVSAVVPGMITRLLKFYKFFFGSHTKITFWS